MTLTLELAPEEAAALEARAKALGVDLVSVVRGLIAQLAVAERPLYQTATLDEWESTLDGLSDDINPTIPPLPDEALRRESLYSDRAR